MADPPFVDDATVSDDDYVLRRIPRQQRVSDPKSAEGIRPSSGAFDDSSDGSPLSMTLASQCDDPASLIIGFDGAGVIRVSVRELRALGQGFVRDPTDQDPAHVLVFGPKPNAFGKKVARAARWVIPPDA
jgi:hypothetical protein